jgi:hypothetical protein
MRRNYKRRRPGIRYSWENRMAPKSLTPTSTLSRITLSAIQPYPLIPFSSRLAISRARQPSHSLFSQLDPVDGWIPNRLTLGLSAWVSKARPHWQHACPLQAWATLGRTVSPVNGRSCSMSFGQAWTHWPHSLHSPRQLQVSCAGLPVMVIAISGQTALHLPHPVHLDGSWMMVWRKRTGGNILILIMDRCFSE